MNGLNENEKELKEIFESIQCKSFEERLDEIRPRMKKKRSKPFFKSKIFLKRFVAATSSLVLILIVGLIVYFSFNKDNTLPENRYLDVDIEKIPCQESDVQNYTGLHIPNLNILFNTAYYLGRHIETQKEIYFLIEGVHADNGIVHNITLMIILEKRYDPPREETYTSGNIIPIVGREMSVLEDDYLDPFYNYKIGFKIGDVRYYLDYGTTSEANDIESFMEIFLA